MQRLVDAPAVNARWARSVTGKPTMRPVTFGGCYGSLHLPTGGIAETGVVLCNPFGYDALCVHRGLRELADTLAASGSMPVLRFDYPGTGDSAGNEEDPARWRAWVDSIKAAARYLRASTGTTRLILCGLRLGAALAVVAAEELGDVDSLVLMAPVIDGRRYMRELSMQHRRWLQTPDGLEAVHTDEGRRIVGAYGFQLHGDTLDQLAAIDLTQREQLAAPRVLIHDICNSGLLTQLTEHYRARGAIANLQIFPEYDKFLVDPWSSVPPRRAFDSVLTWLGCQSGVPRKHTAQILPPSGDARVDFAAGHERPVVFGNGRYVGVFCQPRSIRNDATAVLFVNTGGAHRVGDGRFSVLMARRLAAQGIASLRMDLGGLGDSLQHEGSPTIAAVYARYSVADAAVGVEWLLAAGHPGIVMFGVCSGAYASIRTALTHPRVVGCMSINVPFFFWGSPRAKNIGPSRLFRHSIRDPRKLIGLFTGRSNGLAIAAELAHRWYGRLASRQLLRDLDRKGVQISLVYGSLDAGLDELPTHFKPNGRELEKLTNVTTEILGGVDHALFSRTARSIVMAHFENFLRARILDSTRVGDKDLTASTQECS